MWTYLKNISTNDPTFEARYEEVKEKLSEVEQGDEDVAEQAWRVIRPEILNKIYKHYTNFLILWHFTKEDRFHKQIMSTKRKLMEEEMGPVEAIEQAVKKRKYIIKKATGMLDENPLYETLPAPNLSDSEDEEPDKVEEQALEAN